MTYQPTGQTSTPPPPTTQVQPIDDSTQHPMRRATLWIARALAWLLYAYIIIVEIILLLGFLLLLGGANPSNSFVQWAYRNLDRAMKPFRGIFEPIEIGTTSSDVPAVIETSVLFAMIVYGIVLIAVQVLIQWLHGRVDRLDREDAQYQRQQVADQQRQYAARQQQQAAAYGSQPTAAVPTQPSSPPTSTSQTPPPSTSQTPPPSTSQTPPPPTSPSQTPPPPTSS